MAHQPALQPSGGSFRLSTLRSLRPSTAPVAPRGGAPAATEHCIKTISVDARCVATNPARAEVYAASRDGEILIFSSKEGPESGRGRFNKRAEGVSCLAAVNGELWVGCADGDLLVFDIDGGRLLRKWQAHPGGLCSILPVPDGAGPESGERWATGPALARPGAARPVRHVWTAGIDWQVRIWTAAGEPVKAYGDHKQAVRCLEVVHPSPLIVWSGSDDATIKGWSPSEDQPVLELRGHTAGVSCLCVVNGEVWSGSEDMTIRCWDRTSGAFLRIMKGHTGWVNAICTVGVEVWTGSSDKTIRVWDTESGACLRIIGAHTAYVKQIARLGWQVWSCAGDKTVRLWAAESVFEEMARQARDASCIEAQLRERAEGLREELAALRGRAEASGRDAGELASRLQARPAPPPSHPSLG
eukprot:tig00000989_g6091.t1